MSSAVAFPLEGCPLPRPAPVIRRQRPRSVEYGHERNVTKTFDRHQREASKNPSPDTIRLQLSKILQSDSFVRARRMKRFLEYVVEETLAGRASQVCEYSVRIAVFERNESFEPALDPIVRNDARRLRQKLLEYYARSEGRVDDHVVIEVPKGSYVPVFRTIGDQVDGDVGQQYRLTIRLTRLADGAEICAKQHDFEGSEGFAMHLEVKNLPLPAG